MEAGSSSPCVGQAMQKARQVPDLQTIQSPSSEFLPAVEELDTFVPLNFLSKNIRGCSFLNILLGSLRSVFKFSLCRWYTHLELIPSSFLILYLLSMRLFFHDIVKLLLISACCLTFANHADSLKLSVVVLHVSLSFANKHSSPADSGGFTLS